MSLGAASSQVTRHVRYQLASLRLSVIQAASARFLRTRHANDTRPRNRANLFNLVMGSEVLLQYVRSFEKICR